MTIILVIGRRMKTGQPLKAVGSNRTSALLREKDKGDDFGNKISLHSVEETFEEAR